MAFYADEYLRLKQACRGEMPHLRTTLMNLDAGIINDAGTIFVGTQANTSGSGTALSATVPGAVRVFTDDAGANIADSVRGVQSRLLLTIDQSGGTIRALQGQLKLASGIDVTTGIYTAVQGYVEMMETTGNHAKTGSTLSCIDASLEIGTSLDIDSGGEAYGIHVETTGAGTIVDAGTCAAVGITAASGAAAWPCGVRMKVGSVLQGMRIGDWAGSGAAGSAIPFAATQDFYGDGQLDLLGVYGESTANLTSAFSAKCGRFRHIATVSVAHETYGAVGQMVAKGSTLSHLHAGLMGTFEGQTGTIANSAYTVGHACVTGRLGGHAAITATTPVAGFLAFNNAGAALAGAASISTAFAASSLSASYPWSVGIYMPVGSVHQGIRIGHWAGSGAAGNAIAFGTATDAADASQLDIVACYGETTSDLTSGISAKVSRFRHLVSGSSVQVNHETYGAVGQLVCKSATLLHLHAGVMGTFESNTTAVVSNGAYAYSVAAVMGRIGGGALITATKPVCGFSAVFNGAAISASGVSIAYACCGTSTGTWTYLLAADLCDNIFYAATGTAYECGVKIGAMTALGGAATHTVSGAMRVKVGETLYYIPLYAAGDLAGE